MTDRPSQGGDRRLSAILLVLGASFIFALADAAAKFIVGRLPAVEVYWMRSMVVVVVSASVILARHGPRVLRTRHPVLQALRGLCAVAASLLFLTGLIHLPVAEATAINFIWPLLVTIFSVLILKESVGIRRGLATAAGFLGMVLIVRPGSGAFDPAAVYPLGAAVAWALASVLTRLMSSDEQAETTILWSALIALAAATLAMPFVYVAPTPREIGIGAALGLASALGHAMIVFAFTRASASALAPFTYTQLVWAALCGFVVFGSLPDAWVIAGSCVIAASGIYTAHRERVRRQAAAR